MLLYEKVNVYSKMLTHLKEGTPIEPQIILNKHLTFFSLYNPLEILLPMHGKSYRNVLLRNWIVELLHVYQYCPLNDPQ